MHGSEHRKSSWVRSHFGSSSWLLRPPALAMSSPRLLLIASTEELLVNIESFLGVTSDLLPLLSIHRSLRPQQFWRAEVVRIASEWDLFFQSLFTSLHTFYSYQIAAPDAFFQLP